MAIRKYCIPAAIVGLLALSGAGVVTAGDTPNRFATELLEAHNHARTMDNAPPLEWSHRLAVEAKQWAEVLASEGRMRHASIDERKGAGENLWMGSAGRFSASFMVNAFVDEKQHFKPGKFPDISHTGNWRDVGHYTQVVWKDTRELGCAVVRNQRDDFLVCRYWPAGNIYGAQVR